MKAAAPVLATVAVGTIAITSLSANSSPEGDRSTIADASRSAGAPAAPASVSDPANPATWKLPIEAYLVAKPEARLVGSSRDSVIAECMKNAGFPKWTPAPDLPVLGGKTETDWRYGIHDAAEAARHGYHPDPAEQEAYDHAMMAGAVDKSGADPKVLKSCAQSAGSTVPAVTPSPLVLQIKGDSFQASAQDPKVTAVFAQWSTCMKAKGYVYAKPMDANNDPRFNDGHKVTDLEIATAKADVACWAQFHVEKVWFDVETALQTRAIKANQAVLNEVQAANKDAVSKAKTVAAAR